MHIDQNKKFIWILPLLQISLWLTQVVARISKRKQQLNCPNLIAHLNQGKEIYKGFCKIVQFNKPCIYIYFKANTISSLSPEV